MRKFMVNNTPLFTVFRWFTEARRKLHHIKKRVSDPRYRRNHLERIDTTHDYHFASSFIEGEVWRFVRWITPKRTGNFPPARVNSEGQYVLVAPVTFAALFLGWLAIPIAIDFGLSLSKAGGWLVGLSVIAQGSHERWKFRRFGLDRRLSEPETSLEFNASIYEMQYEAMRQLRKSVETRVRVEDGKPLRGYNGELVFDWHWWMTVERIDYRIASVISASALAGTLCWTFGS